MRKSSCSR